MKRFMRTAILALLAAVAMGSARPAWAQGEVVAVNVTPDVTVIAGLGANMAVLRTSAGLVAVDSLISPCTPGRRAAGSPTGSPALR